MADQSDVEQALVELAAATLYPNGTTQNSIVGSVIRVYRGWPGNAALEADLAAGIAHVSISAMPGKQILTAPLPATWEFPNLQPPALTAAVSGNTVTFAGAATLGQIAGILVDDVAAVYRTVAADTPQSVAGNLCTLIVGSRAATLAGSAVTIPGAERLIARTGADQAAILPLRRQREQYRLACWCADPATRDMLAATLDAAFAGIAFLPLPDSTVGRMLHSSSTEEDDLSTLPLYRRDFAYSVEYVTTLQQAQPTMLFGLFGAAGAATHLTIS